MKYSKYVVTREKSSKAISHGLWSSTPTIDLPQNSRQALVPRKKSKESIDVKIGYA